MAKGSSMFDLPSLDPSKRASEGLNAILNEGSVPDDLVILDDQIKSREAEKAAIQASAVAQTGVDAVTAVAEDPRVEAAFARSGAPMLTVQSERSGARIALFTQDISILEQHSLSQAHILELAALFPEIHIVLLTVERRTTAVTARIADNVWVYVTNSNSWWRMGFDAYRIAKEQLAFAGGFRADLVIAEDPFESGMAAGFIADAYDRPFELHVLTDIYDEATRADDPYDTFHQFMARYTLRRADGVRVRSEFVRNEIVHEHRAIKDCIEVLPVYHNLSVWRDFVPSFSLHERYPQFKFIMLHISSMQPHSHTEQALAAAAPTLLRYGTVGLVIVGSGPLRSAIEKQVVALGLQRQVVFEPTQQEVLSHMKTANILLALDETAEGDDILLMAATVKLPMVTVRGGLAEELFVDGESAFLCDPGDTSCASVRINSYLNENLARTRFALNAQETVFERVEQNYSAYLAAYRSSVERCIAGES